MSYKILEQNGVDNENIDGGAFNNFSAGNRDGIIGGVLSECAVTATGNSIGISPGELIIHGIRVKLISVETLTLASAPSEPIRYQIIAQIELKADKSIAFSLFVQEVADLIQEELYASDLGTYQVEVARFTHGSNGNIEDLSKTLDIIYGGTGGGGDFEIGNVTSNVIDATLPAEAEVNKRIEGGKTYIDFEFYFPDTQETMQAAVSAKNAAEAAQAGAEAAQSAAETAEDNAKASETAAQGYANAASGSAGQAATSAGQAQASAEQAAGSASAAGQSASAAAGSASQAAQSAGAAAGSAGDAADSALAAQGYMEQAKEYAQKEYKIYDSFDDLPVPGDSAFIYLVPSSSATGDDSYAEYLWISEDNKYEYIGSVNDIDLSNYAQVSGTYPNMTVGNATSAANAENATKATQDGEGNNIAATYAKQTGAYPSLTAGKAIESNNNLLYNGDFRLNTQGKTTYPSGEPYNTDEFVDGWNMIESATRTGTVEVISGGGVKVTATAASFGIRQRFETPMSGKTVTGTIKVSNKTGGSNLYLYLWNAAYNTHFASVAIPADGIYQVTYACLLAAVPTDAEDGDGDYPCYSKKIQS